MGKIAGHFFFNDSSVHAYDTSRSTAKSSSYSIAEGSAMVDARQYAVVAAADEARVTAHHHALVTLKDNASCTADGKAKVITASQNKPAFLEKNVLRLLDHPFFRGNPVIAVNFLRFSASPSDREAFSCKLRELGCTDPASTKRILHSMAGKAESALHKSRDGDHLWER
jgi:hypothetical protein